jgi:DHA2 family multidrug resistance protein-like MFS transporter
MAADLIVGTAPAERAGAASGLSETSAELGGALGIAILGSLVTAIYRREVTAAIPDLPVGAEIARDTLGAAAAIADKLPHEIGIRLLETARDVFTQAVVLASSVSAALCLIAAIVIGTLLRNAGQRGSA